MIPYAVATIAISSIAYGQTPLSLEDATRQALLQNRPLLEARAAVGIKQAEAGIARARRWPVLSTTVQAGPILNEATVTFPRGALGTFASTGPIPGEDVRIGIPRRVGGFSVSQIAMPVSQQPRIALGVRSADLETRSVEEQAQAAGEQVTAQLRKVYFQVVALEGARAAAVSYVKTTEELLRLVEQRTAAGTSLPAERAAVQARLARVRADASDLEADIQDGCEQLNLLMGEPLEKRFQLSSRAPELAAASLEEARTRAETNRPEIREARLRLEQADLGIRSKRLEWIPDVNLTLTQYRFLNAGNLAPGQVSIAGLSLTWEPWDWGRKNQETKAARQRREQARLALAQAEAQAELEVGRAWRQWERAERGLDAAHQAVASGAESLRVARQRFEQQAALLGAVLEAETAWELAGQQEARAAAAAGAAWADLELAMGEAQ